MSSDILQGEEMYKDIPCGSTKLGAKGTTKAGETLNTMAACNSGENRHSLHTREELRGEDRPIFHTKDEQRDENSQVLHLRK